MTGRDIGCVPYAFHEKADGFCLDKKRPPGSALTSSGRSLHKPARDATEEGSSTHAMWALNIASSRLGVNKKIGEILRNGSE